MITARFENRDFTPYAHENWESLQVLKYSKNVMGGHKKAVINAFGAIGDMWEFVEMLRFPIYIMDTSRAKETWWGYANRITIWDDEGNAWSINLDHMANRIAIAYSYQFQRFTTAWADNSESQTEYGIKELLLTLREKNTTAAEQARATELDARKYPTMDPGFRGGRKRNQVRIDVRGWRDSLGWRYFEQDEGKEEYVDFGSGQREIGEDDRPTAAQGFQLSGASGWTATAIWLRVKKVGAPADNFQVALWDDNAGLPNAQIEACAVLAGGSITTAFAWYEFTLDSEQALALATQYWIHVSRSGGVDSSNYYMIDTNTGQGYANGNLFIKPAGAWYDKNMDALFKVTGEAATTTQISTIISDVGEFFAGSDIIDASGVSSGTFRAGDQTALYEILELLKTGTTNSRRLLAEVTNIRKLRVYEEPAKNSANWTMNKKREMWDEYGVKVLPQDCPVGMWVQLIDFIPSTANISKLADPSPIFIDEAEYDVLKGTYRILKTRSGVSAAESLTRGIKLG